MEQIGKKDYINEKIPVSKLTILGFQHVLVMYSAAVIVPIILANALQLSNLDLAFLIWQIYLLVVLLLFYNPLVLVDLLELNYQ